MIETPCKVNLHLGIHHELDARGYHRVDSIMAPIALFDTVSVEDAAELSVGFSPALEVAPEKTGVWRAATLLAEALGREPRVRVSVTARIPERAGLGGSSADAGATLRALAARFGRKKNAQPRASACENPYRRFYTQNNTAAQLAKRRAAAGERRDKPCR